MKTAIMKSLLPLAFVLLPFTSFREYKSQIKNLLISEDGWVTKDCYLYNPSLYEFDTFRLAADYTNECGWNNDGSIHTRGSISFVFKTDTVETYTMLSDKPPTFFKAYNFWEYNEKDNILSIRYLYYDDSISYFHWDDTTMPIPKYSNPIKYSVKYLNSKNIDLVRIK